ncbi:hypothetical protein BGW38_010045, partial [Lunasporangiospora selenospora]
PASPEQSYRLQDLQDPVYQQQLLIQQQQEQLRHMRERSAQSLSPTPDRQNPYPSMQPPRSVPPRHPPRQPSTQQPPQQPPMNIAESEEPMRHYNTEIETQETLKRERTRILQRRVVGGSRQIEYKDIANIKPLKRGGFGEILTAEWSRLRVVLKRALADHSEGIEQFEQE